MKNIVVLLLLLLPNLSACTVIAVADAVVSTAVDVTATAAKGTIAVVDAVIPDGDDEDED